METASRSVFYILLLFSASNTESKGDGASADPVAIIWQGFHFQWMRREVGFETPHRLGSVASYISNVSSTCDTTSANANCSVFGTYHVQFTPGVSGDYAYPAVQYQIIAATNPSEIDIATGNKTISFEDNSTTEPVLHANTSRIVNITIELANLPLPECQLLLQGFRVDMKCISTPSYPCNSNAIWPYYFNISLAEPCTVLTEQKVAVCPLSIGLGRGWTPSHGGGKSYNFRMAYNATVFYMRVHYSLTGGTTMQIHRIVKQGDIYQSPLRGEEVLVNTSSVKQSALLGLTEFSWSLTQTHGHLNRGRYLEELVFSVTQQKAPKTKEADEIGYSWMMGYRDPSLSTYPSDVQYSLGVAALVTRKENLLVSASRTANGSVCMDNEDLFTFHCSKHGLKSTTQDTVNIHGTLLI